MKLLTELNTILQEAANKTLNINGFGVNLYDFKASHGYYPGQQVYAGSLDSPPEYTEDQSVHLKVNSLIFEVDKDDKNWLVSFDLGGKDYHKNEALLVRDLQAKEPECRDTEDEIIQNPQEITHLKSLVVEYAKQYDVLGHLYEKGDQKELDPRDDDPHEPERDEPELPRWYDGR